MDELVYLNGAIIPLDEARISVLDYGFLYGYGLFETMRAYGGRVFRLDRHLSRMMSSARSLGMSPGAYNIESAVKETIRANGLSEARIRLTVSIGEGGMVPDPASCRKPTVLVLAGPYRPYAEKVYEKGFRAIISYVRRNSQSPLSRLKTANYLENILARQEARQAGAEEALCLNEKGCLAEGSMSNIFLVTNGILRTPPLDSGVLPGIAREAILELAKMAGIGVLMNDVMPDELYDASEAFLTNSLMEVMPLTEVALRPIGAGIPGPVTVRLAEAYRKLVMSEM